MITIQRNKMIPATLFMPILIICYMIQSVYLVVIVANICCFLGMIYSVKKIRERFCLFAFNIGYYLFLLGGFSMNLLSTGNYGYFSNSYFSSTAEAVFHAAYSVMLSLMVINCLYPFFEGIQRNDKTIREICCITEQTPRFCQFLVFGLIVSYICLLLQKGEETLIMLTTGYVNSYTLTTSLPSGLSYISSLFYVFLFMFWSLMPSRKYTLISLAAVGILEVIILVSGERGEPISMALTCIFYILIRNRCGLEDIVIKKKYVIVCIILLPIAFSGLQALSETRFQREYNETSVFEGAADFLETQGGSIKVVANAYDLRDKISEMGGHTFVSGYIKDYLTNNVFARIILGKTKSLRTAQDAFSGNNFLQTYGYAYAPVTYLNQKGAGSTYIAEVFQDGGYPFLVVMSVFYAWLFAFLNKECLYTPIRMAVVLNISRFISLLPRGMAMQWFTNTFAIQNLIVFLLIYWTSSRVPRVSGEREAE